MSSRHVRSWLATSALAALAVSTVAAVTAPPDDPLWSEQWGPQQVRADLAWDTATGDGAVVAIIDSGIDLEHEDLQGQLVPGATFIECDPSCGDGDWESAEGAGHPHGTHVAGIVAAATGNGVGIAGVAPEAKLMPVKVLNADGSGSFEDIANGIRWAADNGADVLNLSLGALPGVQALELTGVITDAQEAIAYARSKGAVVVVAAGNESFPLCASPSFGDGAICVTATDVSELRSYYSNHPLKPDLAAVAAPGGSGLPFCGEDIVSTVPAGTGTSDVCGYADAYDEYAGTSMAAPHAAGVAALIASLGCDGEATEAILLETARNPVTGARGSYDPVYGYGIVDAEAGTAAAGSTCASATAAGAQGAERGERGARGPRR